MHRSSLRIVHAWTGLPYGLVIRTVTERKHPCLLRALRCGSCRPERSSAVSVCLRSSRGAGARRQKTWRARQGRQAPQRVRKHGGEEVPEGSLALICVQPHGRGILDLADLGLCIPIIGLAPPELWTACCWQRYFGFGVLAP